tara:strand:- start:11 stop:556 length:546 start_codon:yes stop_codon:yes gene_type:complete
MKEQYITKDSTIGEVVENFPEVVKVLESFGVHCVGCPASSFETLEQGFRGHGMNDVSIAVAVKKINDVVVEIKNPVKLEVSMSESAVAKLKSLLNGSESQGLRVKVNKGGCSGFRYTFALGDEAEEDYILEKEGAKLFIDKESLQMINGSEIDYKDSLMDAGFKITNPLAVTTCGCGSSFR